MAINRFGIHGIFLQTNGNNLIQGNFLGTSANGTADLGNTSNGVEIQSPSNTIGGTSAADRNIISGNDAQGIRIITSGATGNVVRGNYIGTDVTGTVDLGNTVDGLQINSSATGNTIGGSNAGAGNVISGNNNIGIKIVTSGNTIQGNHIGTNAAGTASLGNTFTGLRSAMYQTTRLGVRRPVPVISFLGTGLLIFTSSEPARPGTPSLETTLARTSPVPVISATHLKVFT